jgi:hypothetical protein
LQFSRQASSPETFGYTLVTKKNHRAILSVNGVFVSTVVTNMTQWLEFPLPPEVNLPLYAFHYPLEEYCICPNKSQSHFVKLKVAEGQLLNVVLLH